MATKTVRLFSFHARPPTAGPRDTIFASPSSPDLTSSRAFFGAVIKTPGRRIPSGCCARAATGHAAAPPTSAMNSRRFINCSAPMLQPERR
jgi:hypothetical protein